MPVPTIPRRNLMSSRHLPRPALAIRVFLATAGVVAVAPRLAAQPAASGSTGARDSVAGLSCASPRPLTAAPCRARVEVLAEGNIKDVLGGAKNATAAAGTL